MTEGAEPAPPLVDSHAHLDDPKLNADLAGVLGRARDAGVIQVVAIGTTAEDSARTLAIAGRYAGVFAAVGIHPNSAAEALAMRRLVVTPRQNEGRAMTAPSPLPKPSTRIETSGRAKPSTQAQRMIHCRARAPERSLQGCPGERPRLGGTGTNAAAARTTAEHTATWTSASSTAALRSKSSLAAV